MLAQAPDQEQRVRFDPARPFESAYAGYYARGWDVLILPDGKKTPPPKGFTGYNGVRASFADLFAWAEDRPAGNIALRMPAGVVGVDVDAYAKGGKQKIGDQTLARWEAEAGVRFPPTYRVTSRGLNDPSGKCLYRVPEGVRLRTAEGDVELIQRHHRYCVTAPSRNDDDGGNVVRLFAPDGREITTLDAIPRPEDLPELPAALVEYLREGREAEQARSLVDGEHSAFWAALPDGEPCKAMRSKLDAALAATTAGSRHDAMLTAVGAILRVAEMGHTGVHEALRQAEAAFVAAVAGERRGGAKEAAREFARMVNGDRGVGLILAKPTPEDRKGCRCGVSFSDNEIRDVIEANLDDPGTLDTLREVVGDDAFERVAAIVDGYRALAPRTTGDRPPLALVPPVAAPATSPGEEVTVTASETTGAEQIETTTEAPDSLDGAKVDLTAFSLDDRGNGQRFVAVFGDGVAWVPDTRLTRVWNGRVWETDPGSGMRYLAELLTDRMLMQAQLLAAAADKAEGEARAAVKAAGDDAAKAAAKAELERTVNSSSAARAFAKWAGASRMDARLRACATSAQSHPAIKVKSGQWDVRPRLLNVTNGAVELGLDGAVGFREHRKADRLTQIASVEYDPAATCPRFDAYLSQSQPNPAVRRLLAALVGLSIVGGNDRHILPVMIGKKRTGKTTLMEIIGGLLDNTEESRTGYAGSYPLSMLRPKRESGGDPQLSRLISKRFAWTSEAADGITLNADQLKRFSGGDRLSVRDNYTRADAVQDRAPAFVPWIATNHAPQVEGADEALKARIIAVPWTNVRADEDQDPELIKKILTEEAPGVLNWILCGYTDAMTNPMVIHNLPEECVRAAQAMYQDMSLYQRFIAEMCELCPCEDHKSCIPVAVAWEEFKKWADLQREKSGVQRAFGNAIVDSGHESKSVRIIPGGKPRRVYVGLNLNKEARAEQIERQESGAVEM
ncbi:hypothetical protein GCM10022247_56800 [Allokutzneria multivorans]|uniref:SF3 helicase domain-containing protein n=1 Tax=Allokutzneria multivorans TaxID=1142134 RepID=A0ABP7TE10_9PSEU